MNHQNKSKKAKKQVQTKILRLFLSLSVLVLILIAVFLIIRYTGVWEKINSIEKIKAIVESGGVFSFIVFIILQILQTTILQIPAILVTIAGVLIFDPWTTFILSFIAIMIGSIIMFWVGRKAGRKFLNWLVGEEEADVWFKRMSKGKYLFFLMMLFPMFPDDILCVVAGMTDMSFKYFVWTNVVARSLGIACTVFFGCGEIIPFHGWGLIVWGVIAVIVAILFYFSVKYQDKIDDTIDQMFKKNKRKDRS